MSNVAVVSPPCTLTLPGTLAAPSELVSATSAPPCGAGPDNTTVPTALSPPTTFRGSTSSENSESTDGGVTVSSPVCETPFHIAVIPATTVVSVDEVSMLNPAASAPPGTITSDGTVATEGSELVTRTSAPPAGAGFVRTIVPLAASPPITSDGSIDTVESVTGGGSTVRVADTIRIP